MKLCEYVFTDTKKLSEAAITLNVMRVSKEESEIFGWKVKSVELIEKDTLPGNETRYLFHVHGELI